MVKQYMYHMAQIYSHESITVSITAERRGSNVVKWRLYRRRPDGRLELVTEGFYPVETS